MDNNHTEDYVLVLEDRTEVQNASEVGKLSIISDINDEGELKTTPKLPIRVASSSSITKTGC
ncbi:hypothetical protein HMPREF1121_01387 [Porphyromonas sp. KLE 1280]|nr:hypothetical protein HMPREF1121_01387 [Porphyromonas sp. KLE 1280]